MAIVNIPATNTTHRDPESVTAFLATYGIEYQRWTPEHPVAADAPPTRCSPHTREEIDALKARGGYVTADVIDVKPETPNLDMMLDKFSREHWHDEDEVRFIIEGRGSVPRAPDAGRRLRDRGRGRRSDPRAARDASLVRSLRRAADPRDPSVPGHLGLDAALHRQRRRHRLSADLLRPVVRARRRDAADVSEPRAAAFARSCWTSKARRRRSRSSTRRCSRTRARICVRISPSASGPADASRCSNDCGRSSALDPRCAPMAASRRRSLRRMADGSRPQVDPAERAAGPDLGRGLCSGGS